MHYLLDADRALVLAPFESQEDGIRFPHQRDKEARLCAAYQQHFGLRRGRRDYEVAGGYPRRRCRGGLVDMRHQEPPEASFKSAALSESEMP